MHEITGQVHWHEPTGFKRAGFGKFGRPKTPYDLSWNPDDIPIYRDIGVSKVQKPAARAVAAARRAAAATSSCTAPRANGAPYVVEVPAPARFFPKKHIYEENLSGRRGRGSTEVWLDGDTKRHVFEWQKGSLFSIPVNAMHRIVNASSAPALLLAGTTART